MPGNSAYQRSRRRIIAAITGVGFAMIACLCYDLVENRRQAVEAASAVSDTLSRLLSERLDGSIREVDYVLRDLADRANSAVLEGDARDHGLDLVFDAKRATLSQALTLSILDPAGRRIASSPADANLDAERSGIPAFLVDDSLTVMAQANFGTGSRNAASDGETHRGSIVLERALRNRNRSLRAVLAATIDLSIIQRELADLELRKHRIIVVTDQEMRLVARQPERPQAIGGEIVNVAMNKLLHDLKDAGPGADTLRSETGTKYYFARIGEYPFYVAIGEEKGDIMAEWNRRLGIYGAAAAIILALMFFLVRLMDKNFVRSAELAARLVALESASDMIVIADLEGRAEYVNPALELATGMSKSEALGSRRAIFGLEEADTHAALQAAAAGKSWRGEIAAKRADGSSIIEEVTIAPVLGPEDVPLRIVAVLRDVTERRRLQERLERLAHYDPLTTLPNRALFFDRLEGAVSRARRDNRRFALLFIDLDGFKAVNDHFGHDAGDFLLFELAKRLKTAIRDSDTAGRMGGDEFIVLLENIARPEDAQAVAEKIHAILGEPAVIPAGATVSVGASIGIAIFPDDGADSEAIVKAADSAMYANKLAGGDRR
jgi:diguanylate cyclase (GGDEF)-like protein/PAS domain S-box-containing protein